jgi:hypothetical protein
VKSTNEKSSPTGNYGYRVTFYGGIEQIHFYLLPSREIFILLSDNHLLVINPNNCGKNIVGISFPFNSQLMTEQILTEK